MQTNQPRRVIYAAALLSERYLNPEVAALNNHRSAASPRRAAFWLSVGALLSQAYGRRSCATDYEIAARREIEAARAAMTA